MNSDYAYRFEPLTAMEAVHLLSENNHVVADIIFSKDSGIDPELKTYYGPYLLTGVNMIGVTDAMFYSGKDEYPEAFRLTHGVRANITHPTHNNETLPALEPWMAFIGGDPIPRYITDEAIKEDADTFWTYHPGHKQWINDFAGDPGHKRWINDFAGAAVDGHPFCIDVRCPIAQKYFPAHCKARNYIDAAWKEFVNRFNDELPRCSRLIHGKELDEIWEIAKAALENNG